MIEPVLAISRLHGHNSRMHQHADSSGVVSSQPELYLATGHAAAAIVANPPAYGHTHCAEALNVPLHIIFTMPWTPTKARAVATRRCQQLPLGGQPSQRGRHVAAGSLCLCMWPSLRPSLQRQQLHSSVHHSYMCMPHALLAGISTTLCAHLNQHEAQ